MLRFFLVALASTAATASFNDPRLLVQVMDLASNNDGAIADPKGGPAWQCVTVAGSESYRVRLVNGVVECLSEMVNTCLFSRKGCLDASYVLSGTNTCTAKQTANPNDLCYQFYKALQKSAPSTTSPTPNLKTPNPTTENSAPSCLI